MLKYRDQIRVICFKSFIFAGLLVCCFCGASLYLKEYFRLQISIESLRMSIESKEGELSILKRRMHSTVIEEKLIERLEFSRPKDELLLFLDFLNEDFHLKNVNYKIDSHAFISDMISKTKISIGFSCDSSENLYSSLFEILEKIPGFVYIESLNADTKEDNFVDVDINLSTYTTATAQLFYW